VRYCRPIKTSTRGETLAPTNLSPHSRSLFRAPHHSSEATTGPAMGGGRRHHLRPPRRRTRPPMGGRAPVEWFLGGTYPRARPHGSRSDDSSSTCSDHDRLEHQRSSQFPSAQWQVAARDLPAWRVDSSTTSSCGHGDLHTKGSSSTFFSFSISSRSNSSPFTCFSKRRVLPRLDPHPSPGKLIPLIG
jgi:hypothetical protein